MAAVTDSKQAQQDVLDQAAEETAVIPPVDTDSTEQPTQALPPVQTGEQLLRRLGLGGTAETSRLEPVGRSPLAAISLPSFGQRGVLLALGALLALVLLGMIALGGPSSGSADQATISVGPAATDQDDSSGETTAVVEPTEEDEPTPAEDEPGGDGPDKEPSGTSPPAAVAPPAAAPSPAVSEPAPAPAPEPTPLPEEPVPPAP